MTKNFRMGVTSLILVFIFLSPSFASAGTTYYDVTIYVNYIDMDDISDFNTGETLLDYQFSAYKYGGTIQQTSFWQKKGTGFWYEWTKEDVYNGAELGKEFRISISNVADRSGNDIYVYITEEDLFWDYRVFDTEGFDIANHGIGNHYLYDSKGLNDVRYIVQVSYA